MKTVSVVSWSFFFHIDGAGINEVLKAGSVGRFNLSVI
jgi:hypothetical protein